MVLYYQDGRNEKHERGKSKMYKKKKNHPCNFCNRFPCFDSIGPCDKYWEYQEKERKGKKK